MHISNVRTGWEPVYVLRLAWWRRNLKPLLLKKHSISFSSLFFFFPDYILSSRNKTWETQAAAVLLAFASLKTANALLMPASVARTLDALALPATSKFDNYICRLCRALLGSTHVVTIFLQRLQVQLQLSMRYQGGRRRGMRLQVVANAIRRKATRINMFYPGAFTAPDTKLRRVIYVVFLLQTRMLQSLIAENFKAVNSVGVTRTLDNMQIPSLHLIHGPIDCCIGSYGTSNLHMHPFALPFRTMQIHLLCLPDEQLASMSP